MDQLGKQFHSQHMQKRAQTLLRARKLMLVWFLAENPHKMPQPENYLKYLILTI